jgi:PIN domain nuclease of toxin-antitoxin system
LRLLLDTHAVLWLLNADERLSENAERHMTDGANEVLLSAVVVWEVAIKRALGKLVVPDEYLGLLLDAGVTTLPVTLGHAAAIEHLTLHHRDPFDRMLIAQAGIEGAAVVSRDPAFRPYGVPLVW